MPQKNRFASAMPVLNRSTASEKKKSSPPSLPHPHSVLPERKDNKILFSPFAMRLYVCLFQCQSCCYCRIPTSRESYSFDGGWMIGRVGRNGGRGKSSRACRWLRSCLSDKLKIMMTVGRASSSFLEGHNQPAAEARTRVPMQYASPSFYDVRAPVNEVLCPVWYERRNFW